MVLKQYKLKTSQKGVSLIEFVIGLVLLAIVLLGSTLFFAAQKNQLDPVFQFRAVSLAEALAEQVLSVKYDAANNPFQQTRCDDLALLCSKARENDHDTLNSFDNVDDFNLWCDKEGAGGTSISGATLAAQLGLARTELYQRFTVSSCVEQMPKIGVEPAYKKVSIKVSIDSGSSISFPLQRYNIR